ncbi:MAG TPA: HAD family phosphatase [Candidatus Sulfomarinibacteraceae bacterium]|nr:HAD family phosphatase [Candidatus Sulfomarinibacteraceae bacterium]
MIQAVIFDVGGVLVRTEDHNYRRRWEQKLGLAPGASEAIVFGDEMGTRAQAGAISDEELWQWIGDHLELDEARLAQFRRDFWAGDVLDTELADYVRSLRPAYQTAIISNFTDALRRKLTDVYPVADAFDLIVCSAEEQTMKPAPEIYKTTLEELGRQPAETVFIDDSKPNVVAARQLGMHAIHYQASMDVPAALARFGIRPDQDVSPKEIS